MTEQGHDLTEDEWIEARPDVLVVYVVACPKCGTVKQHMGKGFGLVRIKCSDEGRRHTWKWDQ